MQEQKEENKLEEKYIHNPEKNLKALAEQLALNYFNRASIDFHRDQRENETEIRRLKRLKKIVFNNKDQYRLSRSCYKTNDAYRNILVIGAGATFNAFENIPLAHQAISDIQERIKLGNIRHNNEDVSLNFDYFITFYQYFKSEIDLALLSYEDLHKYSDLYKLNKPVLNSYLLKELKIEDVKAKSIVGKIQSINEEIIKLNDKIIGAQNKIEPISFKFMPGFAEPDDNKKDTSIAKYSCSKEIIKISALEEIGKKYFREYDRLKLHSSEDNNSKKRDFETSLHLLSEMFSVTTIRKLIQEIYNYKHGPTLTYEIIAHLFKNGFIDVIVNFNFDEFLDQAIANEMHRDGYDLILSDGDCKSYKELAFDGRLRQPLYIKPHGTASHKSSMRFTKNQYYELPLDMRTLLEEIMSGKILTEKTEANNNEHLDAKKEEHSDNRKAEHLDEIIKINLITTGFGMESLEFNDIIAKNFPEGSQIFNMYYFKFNKIKGETLEESAQREKELATKTIKNEYDKIEKIFAVRNDIKIGIKLIDYEKFEKSVGLRSRENYTSLGITFHKLFAEMQNHFKKEFKPSDISRHLIVTDIFGNKTFWNTLKDFEEQDENKYGDEFLKCYFHSSDYYKDRLMVEVFINLISNNGRIHPSVLMKGNAGVYYSLYYDKFIEEDKNASPDTLAKIISNIDPNKYNINPLAISYFINDDSEDVFTKQYNFNTIVDLFLEGKNKNFSKGLNSFLENLNKDQRDEIKHNFKKIRNSNNSRIQSKLRSSIHHIFKNYKKADLITCSLSLKLNFYDGVANFFEDEIFKPDTICIIADYGYLLTRFMNEICVSKNIKHVYLILSWPKKIEFDNKSVSEMNKRRENYFHARELAIKRLVSAFPENKEIFERKAHILFREEKRHNHHMNIFTNQGLNELKHKSESKGIYYYKKGLSENINPILINEVENIKNLLNKFGYYSKRAKEEIGIFLKNEADRDTEDEAWDNDQWEKLNKWIRGISEKMENGQKSN